MAIQQTQRYCADTQTLAAMKRDGIGWGHDVDCGCFHDVTRGAKPGTISRIINALRKRG